MNAWSNLPNAKHIDWVLASLKSNIDVWNQAYDQAWYEARDQAYDQARVQARDQARVQALNQALDQAWYEARDQAYDQAYDQALDQVSDQAWNQARGQAYEQASGVLVALIAYDDCDQYLSMTFDELKTWVALTEKPQAILLLPMKYVKEKLNECLV